MLFIFRAHIKTDLRKVNNEIGLKILSHCHVAIKIYKITVKKKKITTNLLKK